MPRHFQYVPSSYTLDGGSSSFGLGSGFLDLVSSRASCFPWRSAGACLATESRMAFGASAAGLPEGGLGQGVERDSGGLALKGVPVGLAVGVGGSGSCFCASVKGDSFCVAVKGDCSISGPFCAVKGDCSISGSFCVAVKGDCTISGSFCASAKGDCSGLCRPSGVTSTSDGTGARGGGEGVNNESWEKLWLSVAACELAKLPAGKRGGLGGTPPRPCVRRPVPKAPAARGLA